MSEEKASEKILKKLEAMEQEIQKLKTSNSESEAHHVFDPNCPTCKPKIDEWVKPKLEQAKEEVVKIFKERASLPYECEGDGCGVQKDEEKCPVCGGTKARKR